MITYEFVWEKDGLEGSFTVTAFSDDECIKIGHDEVESWNGIVTDYYQI